MTAHPPVHVVTETESTAASTVNSTVHNKPSTATATVSVSKDAAAILLRQKSVEYARRNVEQTFQHSRIKDTAVTYPKFDYQELTLGKVLGKGGFGTVSEVRAFRVTPGLTKSHSTRSATKDRDDTEVDDTTGEMESRQFIAQHCLRHGGDARYAIKVLSPEVVKDPALYLQGMIDMAVETRFLSSIVHPNIMKMRAIAKVDAYSEGYFIVMDRLYDTLEARLKKWKVQSDRVSGILSGRLMDRKGKKALKIYEDRIVAAFDLSAALEHLHEHRVIHRDIKPENIGFDIRDDIKIFDFGLAKELTGNIRNDDGTYKLTEMTGSPRYMAPEVANGEPYNESCDVYSFAVLLWQILSLKTPYELYTPKSLRAKVYNGLHRRPPLDDAWSNTIKLCLKRSWDKDIHLRCSMSNVSTVLRKECVRVREGNESGLEHYRRRSTFVFRGNR